MAVGAMTFEGDILLVVAIVLGLVATVMTYLNSRKLVGQVFEKPFIYFSMGIFFTTFSLIDVAFLQSFWSEYTVAIVHDVSFIIGLGLVLFASVKITRFLQGLEGFESKLESKLDKVDVRKEK